MSKKTYNIRISKRHEDLLTEYKEKTGIAKTDAIRQALEEFFDGR